jgi:hypothetical protein
LALLATLVLLGQALPASGAGRTIFELEDPRGDDHGDGSLVYPLRSDFERGDLDLLKIEAQRVKGGTRFAATFARPVRVPGREAVDDLGTQLSSVARFGFYTFNLDIYIDTDRKPGSGARGTMPGRNAVLAEDSAWERAIILTPKPHEARGELKRMMIKQMTKELREIDSERTWSVDQLEDEVPEDLSERVFFPVQVRVLGNAVRFFVPDSFLGGPASPDWGYTVMVSGSNLLQSLDLAAKAGLADSLSEELMILPVSPGTWTNRFGGGREGEELQPPLVDIIVPAGKRSQESLLEDFSTRDNRPAVLPAVVPSQN